MAGKLWKARSVWRDRASVMHRDVYFKREVALWCRSWCRGVVVLGRLFCLSLSRLNFTSRGHQGGVCREAFSSGGLAQKNEASMSSPQNGCRSSVQLWGFGHKTRPQCPTFSSPYMSNLYVALCMSNLFIALYVQPFHRPICPSFTSPFATHPACPTFTSPCVCPRGSKRCVTRRLQLFPDEEATPILRTNSSSFA